MVESLVTLTIIATCAAVFVLLRTRVAAQPARANAARLQQHASWLQTRLERAHAENWDGEMIAKISAELRATNDELAQAIAR